MLFQINPGAGGGITFDAKALLSEIKNFMQTSKILMVP